MDDERLQRIRNRAHALWEKAGRPHGEDAEHWSQAELEIAAEEKAKPSAVKSTSRRSRKPGADAEGTSDAPKARRTRSQASAADTSKAPRAAKEKPASKAGNEPRPEPAATEDVASPKPRRGRKPKSAADGPGTAE